MVEFVRTNGYEMNIIEQLQELGLVAQLSADQELVSHLESGVRTVYCGFDPTADSLHIGNLVSAIGTQKVSTGWPSTIASGWWCDGNDW